MTPETKQHWMHIAEIIDANRIVPRALVGVLLTWTIVVVGMILNFYFMLPAVERTTEVSAFATLVISSVTGIFGMVFKTYATTGRDWTAQPNPT